MKHVYPDFDKKKLASEKLYQILRWLFLMECYIVNYTSNINKTLQYPNWQNLCLEYTCLCYILRVL